MANFQNQIERELFGSFLLGKMQQNHKTIENFAADLSMETRTLRTYLEGTFPPQKLSTIYRLLEELNGEFSEFESFLHEQTIDSSKSNKNFNATTGPTININTGNTISKSPIGTQGNVIFNHCADEE